VDITIEDAPDVPTLEGETFAAVMDVLSKGAPPPMLKVMIELHPGLRASVKKKLNTFIDEMIQQQAQAAQAQQQNEGQKLQVEGARAQSDAQTKERKVAVDEKRLELEAAEAGFYAVQEATRPEPQPAA
jgi:hypothetical protein